MFFINGTWQNWSGRYKAEPKNMYAPTSINDVQRLVASQQRGETIRVTGAAHSFSPVAMPQHNMLTLHHLRGLIDVDTEHNTATFYAGTYLYEVGPLLAQHGLALANMGDIDTQTLAGVISTGTHGTGVTLGSFSSMVVRWGFVNGHGDYVSHTRSDDDLSNALHVSLGLLGILVDVTIHVVPLYSLAYTATKSDVTYELTHFEQTVRTNRHAEWFYFPGSEHIQVKKMNAVPFTERSERERQKDMRHLQLIENQAFDAICRLCTWQPKLSHRMSALSAKLISDDARTDVCYHIFPTPRSVKFVEAEYAIPLAAFPDCLRDIHKAFKQRRFDVNFPIECRTTIGERGFLSPTQHEESAFLAFHMYNKQHEHAYFRWVHELMQHYGGRAHWGKVNTYNGSTIRTQYPHIDTFLAMRQQHDPHDRFFTSVMKQMLLEH